MLSQQPHLTIAISNFLTYIHFYRNFVVRHILCPLLIPLNPYIFTGNTNQVQLNWFEFDLLEHVLFWRPEPSVLKILRHVKEEYLYYHENYGSFYYTHRTSLLHSVTRNGFGAFVINTLQALQNGSSGILSFMYSRVRRCPVLECRRIGLLCRQTLY